MTTAVSSESDVHFTIQFVGFYYFMTLNLQCQGQYSTRINDVRSYMQQIDSDVQLRYQQKQQLKLGKMMQGNNKGNNKGTFINLRFLT